MVTIRVKLPTEYQEEDIGDLDFRKKIPFTEGLKCSTCGEKIEHEAQITIGGKAGYKGLFFFHEVCLIQGQLFDK